MSQPVPNERRKNFELRAIIAYLSELAYQSGQSSWDCISEIYKLMNDILKQSKDLSVSQDLLSTFETNRRIIEDIYRPGNKVKINLSNPLTAYFMKLKDITDRILHPSAKNKIAAEDPEVLKQKLDTFFRDYVVALIMDQRVVLLMLMTVMYRRLQNQNTQDLRTSVARFTDILKQNAVRPDRALTLLIYNLCHSSVEAIEGTDYAHASLYCERAVELFKMIPNESKVKDAIRSQIEDAMRITTERLVNRIQEREEAEEIEIVESVVARLINIDLIAYLLPQLVFFLIRAQKYEDCMRHLDRILNAENMTGEFMDYQTAITIGFEWCDSLLKAERYSRGKVDFSFFQKEKDNITKVFKLAKSIAIPPMEDETFFNVEVEKLAVTFSHLGTLFFVTGNIEWAAESYQKSFETILLKSCSRNRDSVDEVMDRYKDTLYHPLNSAPIEAHVLIGLYASDKGYDFLLDAQLKRLEQEGTPSTREEQSMQTLINPQKQMIADLMDATQNKLRRHFQEPFAAYKPFIENKFAQIKEKMKI
jgi:hypothetical protein